MAKRECENYITPVRMFGGLYFVGTYEASTHIIDTGAGLMLIDPGYERNLSRVLENIRTVGYDPSEIRYIILSHGHVDHAEATASLLEYTDARTFIGEGDLCMVRDSFTPDVLLRDGDEITLGSVTVRCVATPGHTDGTFSFFFDLTEGGRTLRAGMHGGAGTNTLTDAYLTERGLPYSRRQLFREGMMKVRGERVDIFVGNHTWNNDTDLKIKAVLSGNADAFIDGGEWVRFIDERIKRIDQMIGDAENDEKRDN